MIRFILATAFLICNIIVHAQAPVAGFSANTVQGCAALSVTFTDQSTGSPKFWNWDFGNGQLANTQNPTTSFPLPGKYTVTLVVRNADGTNGITKTDYITVNNSPIADFTSNLTNACLGALVQFTDASVPTDGAINKWEWDFGDGTVSTDRNPVKRYNAIGFYTVVLKITSTTGCVKSITKPRHIRILSGVKAEFSDSVNRVCLPPFITNFKNETSGPGVLSYLWDLGNGSTSVAKDTIGSYPAAGDYNIQLIARSDLGCADTVRRSIRISSANTVISSPDSACINSAVTFSNSSTPAPLSSLWNFGDGTSSQQLNPAKTFTAAGIYQVKLVNRYATCSDSLVKTFTVLSPPAVDFTSASQGSCKAPFTAAFSDLTPNAASWQWNFGDGGTSTSRNPSHTYNTAGEFDVTLTVTTSFGCRNTIVKPKYIRITPPVVSISPAGGCIPFAYSPTANIASVDAVQTYLWEFGEGSATSTQAIPSYTYTSAGNYTVRLTITTAGGCTASVTLPNAVRTGTVPATNFSANEDSACLSQPVQFTDLSVPANEWFWNFGDGTTSSVKNPQHAYTDTGRYTVSLTAINGGCPQTVTRAQFVTILPPVAKFDYKVDCNNGFAVTFINEAITNPAIGPVSYEWNFGDPRVPISTVQYPGTVYFPETERSYTVTLKVTNGNCTSTITKSVSLLSVSADFTTSKPTVCKYERFRISAVNSNPANVVQYEWSINGATPFIAPASFDTSFNQASSYQITLRITDRNGCFSTVTKTILNVIGPTAAFTLNNTSGCSNTLIDFNDQSSPASDLVKWTFDFGDGVTQPFTGRPFSHLYKDTGNFNVRLTVQDRIGCTDSLTLFNAVQITKPVSNFGAAQTDFCPNSPLQFYDSSRSFASLTYLWNFGDGSTSTLKDPVHSYAGRDSSYTVTLQTQDQLGCSDTIIKTRYIKIESPRSAFDVKDTVAICPPLETKFFFKGQNYESFYWDFGDSTTSTLRDSVSHFYNEIGTYKAKLFLVGKGGCVDSSEHTISVVNAYEVVKIDYSPTNACNSLLVDFTVTTPPSTSFLFYFADGVTDNSQRKTFQHFYNQPNTYTPFLELKDSAGCQLSVAVPQPIIIIGAEPFFSADRKTFCDAGTVYFTNYTIGNDPVVSSVWNFGDGATSTDKDPIHSYSTPGRYLASLTVNTLNGCTRTITDTIRVYATPQPSITANSVVCLNSAVDFRGTLARPDTSITWNWNFGNGQTSTLQNPSVTYAAAGTYTVTLEAVNPLGCKNTATQTVTVAPLPVITTTEQPVIPIGTGVPLPVTYSQNIATYQWTPATGLSCTNCPNPVASPSINTTYTVNVVDSNGCVGSGEITVSVVCNDKNYFVPNTFTPNGDGNNDVFYPRGSSIARVQSMRIFNRWGELVFEKRNFAANSAGDGWNGSYKGKTAQEDVYVYIVEFICENGLIIPFKGNVTLLR